MRAGTTKKGLAAAAAGLALAAALAGAPGPATAMSGGRGGAWTGGARAAGESQGARESGGGARGARLHHYSGSIRLGGRFRDSAALAEAERDRYRVDPGHFESHWGGLTSIRDFGGWPGPSLFRRYGDGDFQPCMRRDVYGDLYQAC
jgi:hypothetical protein